MTNQRVVHLGQGHGQGACIYVHKAVHKSSIMEDLWAVLGSDMPCFQCTPLVEIKVSIYHCGTASVDLMSFIHHML